MNKSTTIMFCLSQDVPGMLPLTSGNIPYFRRGYILGHKKTKKIQIDYFKRKKGQNYSTVMVHYDLNPAINKNKD